MALAQDLPSIVHALAAANDDLLAAAAAGDGDRVADLMRHVAALEERRNRLLRRAGAVPAPTYETAVPQRNQVIRTLRLGGRPMSTRLLADLARARYGYEVATQKLASLRRDEAASWRAAHGRAGRTALRDVYVVPALTHDRYAPVRGTLALSSWPLTHRLVAPASPRIDMLWVTLAVAHECDAGPDDAPWQPAVRRVLWRLARTVPGLEERGVSDLAAVRDAIEAELDVIEAADMHERQTAVSRAEAALDEYTLLFGTATGALSGALAREA